MDERRTFGLFVGRMPIYLMMLDGFCEPLSLFYWMYQLSPSYT